MPEKVFKQLMDRGILTPEQAEQYRQNRFSADSWIGRLMVNHGLINIEHVDEILNRQDLYGGFFGENAVALGYIDRRQLDILLAAQELRRGMDLIERLALNNVLAFEDGMQLLAGAEVDAIAACSPVVVKSGPKKTVAPPRTPASA
jgi:hypothetical protein